jgi:hypothetical protein
MAPSSHRHCSRTSAEVRDDTSWAQDNPCSSGFQNARDSYDAHGHRKLVTVEQYSQAVLEIVARHSNARSLDPQQLRRELRYLDTQVKTCVTGEALASNSPLLIKRRAYSDTAGHAPQQKASPKRRETKSADHQVGTWSTSELVSRRVHRFVERWDGVGSWQTIRIEERDSELVVEEGEVCSENRYTDVNPTRLRRVPDLESSIVRCTMNVDAIREHEAHKSECLKVVRDQENDVARRLDLSRETAHHTDGRHVENLRKLVVKRGNNAKGSVGGLDGNWAQSETQYTLKNDNECRKVRNNIPHGHPTAVFPVHRRFHEESSPCRLDDAGPCVREDISKRRAVPTALPSATQVAHSPVTPKPTRSQTRVVTPNGPQMAVRSIPTCSSEKSRYPSCPQ